MAYADIEAQPTFISIFQCKKEENRVEQKGLSLAKAAPFNSVPQSPTQHFHSYLIGQDYSHDHR